MVYARSEHDNPKVDSKPTIRALNRTPHLFPSQSHLVQLLRPVPSTLDDHLKTVYSIRTGDSERVALQQPFPSKTGEHSDPHVLPGEEAVVVRRDGDQGRVRAGKRGENGRDDTVGGD